MEHNLIEPSGQGCAERGPRARGRTLAATALAGLLALGLACGEATARSAPDGFADLAEKLLPAVVNISTTQVVRGQRGPELPQFPPGSPFEEFFKEFFERRQKEEQAPARRATSLGSGFVIDNDGYVVTNNHVIEGADEVNVTFQDETTLPAKVIGRDQKTDLALLKVEPQGRLTALKWGDSSDMRVGDWVLAIGNPFGLGGTVTAGIVSARGRDIQAGPYDDFIQTDASINRGNSGGPMFNLRGEVVGVNTAIYSPSGGSVGIGFAVPSAQAKAVIDQLREFGQTRRGWFGVHIQTVTKEIAEGLGLPEVKGALVASVAEGGPAAVAGIQQGDVILQFDRKEIRRMRDLPTIVAETPIGKQVEVTLWRKGSMVRVNVAVGKLEEAEVATLASAPAESQERTVPELGLTISPLTDELRARFEIAKDASGVVVVKVTEASPASEKGLSPGDVIVEISQERVSTPAQIAAKVAEAVKAGRKSVLLLVDRVSRDGQPEFLALPIERG